MWGYNYDGGMGGGGGGIGTGKPAVIENIDASVGPQIIFIPDAITTREIRIYCKADISLNTITIRPEIIGQTISNEAEWVLEAKGQYISVDAENGHWWIIANN